jgi:hypothetical protein
MRGLVSLVPWLAAARVGALPASPAGDASSGTAAASFAKTDGLFFNIDGETKYYAGTNCYWCGFLTADEDVDKVFSDMAAADLKIIRVCQYRSSPFVHGISVSLICLGIFPDTSVQAPQQVINSLKGASTTSTINQQMALCTTNICQPVVPRLTRERMALSAWTL